MKFSSTYQPIRVPLSDRRYKVFVYGSLRQGFGNHAILKESLTTKFLGFATIRAKLFTAHWGWPHIIFSRSNKDRVIGEIYEVDHFTFERLDRLEGYDKSRSFGGCLFYRKRVTATQCNLTQTKRTQLSVWVYEAGDSLRSRGEYIASGDWRLAKTAYDNGQRNQKQSLQIFSEDDDSEDEED